MIITKRELFVETDTKAIVNVFENSRTPVVAFVTLTDIVPENALPVVVRFPVPEAFTPLKLRSWVTFTGGGFVTVAVIAIVGRRQTQPPPKIVIVYVPSVVLAAVEIVRTVVPVPNAGSLTVDGLIETFGYILSHTSHVISETFNWKFAVNMKSAWLVRRIVELAFLVAGIVRLVGLADMVKYGPTPTGMNAWWICPPP